jgi:hypothetical protein
MLPNYLVSLLPGGLPSSFGNMADSRGKPVAVLWVGAIQEHLRRTCGRIVGTSTESGEGSGCNLKPVHADLSIFLACLI